MQKSRRIGAIVAMATVAAGIGAATAAAPAAAVVRGPQPVSNWLQQVRANTSSWVTIHWRTDRRVCDVEVRVRGDRVKVDYPGFRRSTSLSRGDTLRPGRGDFSRIRVTPYAQRTGVTRLWATISYDECGWRSRTMTRTAVLSLPVLRNTWPGGNGGPGGPGHGHPGGPGQGGPGGPGQGGPGTPGQHSGPGGGHSGPGQGGPGHTHSGGGQGLPSGAGNNAGPGNNDQRP
jgi:hypothetical protein